MDNDLQKIVDFTNTKIAEINKLKTQIYNYKNALPSKLTVFDTENVKTRINYNIQVLYAAALFNLLYKSNNKIIKNKCKLIKNFPEMFQVKANLILNNEEFEWTVYYEMLYWNFFNVPEDNKDIEYVEIPNNQILFNLMDYIRRTR